MSRDVYEPPDERLPGALERSLRLLGLYFLGACILIVSGLLAQVLADVLEKF
jgi:hypothetical protein